MNVNWPRTEMPSEIAGRATSLMDLGGGAVDRVALLRSYLIGLAGEVAGLEAGISPLERYRAASWLNGRDARISVGERVVAGRVRGIGGDGSLELETNGGVVTIAYGEVVQVGVEAVPMLLA